MVWFVFMPSFWLSSVIAIVIDVTFWPMFITLAIIEFAIRSSRKYCRYTIED